MTQPGRKIKEPNQINIKDIQETYTDAMFNELWNVLEDHHEDYVCMVLPYMPYVPKYPDPIQPTTQPHPAFLISNSDASKYSCVFFKKNEKKNKIECQPVNFKDNNKRKPYLDNWLKQSLVEAGWIFLAEWMVVVMAVMMAVVMAVVVVERLVKRWWSRRRRNHKKRLTFNLEI